MFRWWIWRAWERRTFISTSSLLSLPPSNSASIPGVSPCAAALLSGPRRMTPAERGSWGRWTPWTILLSVFHSVILLDHHCLQGELKFAAVLSICYKEELRVEGVKPGIRATRILVFCKDLHVTYRIPLLRSWLHVSGISYGADFSKFINSSNPGKCWKIRKLLRMRKSKD